MVWTKFRLVYSLVFVYFWVKSRFSPGLVLTLVYVLVLMYIFSIY